MLANKASLAKYFTNRPSSAHRPLTDRDDQVNRTKSKVRARVETIFRVMKRQFGFIKVRYKGLGKNAHHLFVSCALVNIVMAKKKKLRQSRQHL